MIRAKRSVGAKHQNFLCVCIECNKKPKRAKPLTDDNYLPCRNCGRLLVKSCFINSDCCPCRIVEVQRKERRIPVNELQNYMCACIECEKKGDKAKSLKEEENFECRNCKRLIVKSCFKNRDSCPCRRVEVDEKPFENSIDTLVHRDDSHKPLSINRYQKFNTDLTKQYPIQQQDLDQPNIIHYETSDDLNDYEDHTSVEYTSREYNTSREYYKSGELYTNEELYEWGNTDILETFAQSIINCDSSSLKESENDSKSVPESVKENENDSKKIQESEMSEDEFLKYAFETSECMDGVIDDSDNEIGSEDNENETDDEADNDVIILNALKDSNVNYIIDIKSFYESDTSRAPDIELSIRTSDFRDNEVAILMSDTDWMNDRLIDLWCLTVQTSVAKSSKNYLVCTLNIWDRIKNNDGDSCLDPYVQLALPIIIPVNVRKSHWVFYVVRWFSSHVEIQVYDSMNDSKILGTTHSQNCRNIDQYLIRQNCLKRYEYKKMKCPQQFNHNDCGLFVMICILHIINEQDLNYNQEMISSCRGWVLKTIANCAGLFEKEQYYSWAKIVKTMLTEQQLERVDFETRKMKLNRNKVKKKKPTKFIEIDGDTISNGEQQVEMADIDTISNKLDRRKINRKESKANTKICMDLDNLIDNKFVFDPFSSEHKQVTRKFTLFDPAMDDEREKLRGGPNSLVRCDYCEKVTKDCRREHKHDLAHICWWISGFKSEFVYTKLLFVGGSNL
jgi:Ulp1 protease family, C-terminal catalytic domain